MHNIGTAQVKDIKPGVLSKIFTLSELNGSKLEDESLRELFKASHKLQKCLLNFANYKPSKKGGKSLTATDVIDQGIKDLVDKIVRFKFSFVIIQYSLQETEGNKGKSQKGTTFQENFQT